MMNDNQCKCKPFHQTRLRNCQHTTTDDRQHVAISNARLALVLSRRFQLQHIVKYYVSNRRNVITTVSIRRGTSLRFPARPRLHGSFYQQQLEDSDDDDDEATLINKTPMLPTMNPISPCTYNHDRRVRNGLKRCILFSALSNCHTCGPCFSMIYYIHRNFIY